MDATIDGSPQSVNSETDASLHWAGKFNGGALHIEQEVNVQTENAKN